MERLWAGLRRAHASSDKAPNHDRASLRYHIRHRRNVGGYEDGSYRDSDCCYWLGIRVPGGRKPQGLRAGVRDVYLEEKAIG
jgi:hypothetical protein